jgi:hypothetical protein
MILLGTLMLSALTSANQPPAPSLRRSSQGEPIVDPRPDAPQADYRIRFASGPMTIAERLERIIPYEPYRILASDEGAGTATVRTTRRGAWILTVNNHHWSAIRVAEVSPAVAQLGRECVEILATLRFSGPAEADDNHAYDSAVCPPAEAAKGLVIEGLDRRGRRLWLATAEDDRVVRAVMAPDGSGHGPPVRVDRPAISATLEVPTVAGLATLRWYAVEDGALAPIGESRWPSR